MEANDAINQLSSRYPNGFWLGYPDSANPYLVQLYIFMITCTYMYPIAGNLSIKTLVATHVHVGLAGH